MDANGSLKRYQLLLWQVYLYYIAGQGDLPFQGTGKLERRHSLKMLAAQGSHTLYILRGSESVALGVQFPHRLIRSPVQLVQSMFRNFSTTAESLPEARACAHQPCMP